MKTHTNLRKNFPKLFSDLRSNRIVYNIDQKLEYFELEKLFTDCEIDFFVIDTACFNNVKDYQEMINQINYLNQKFNNNIQIILELRGRKIIAELNTQTIKTFFKKDLLTQSFLQNHKSRNEIVSVILKKGDKLIITNHSQEFNKEKSSAFCYYEILIKYLNLNKMLKIGDQIIVNDNKCSFKVEKIYEISSAKDEDKMISMSHENPATVKLVLDKLEKLTLDDLKASTQISEQKSSALLNKLLERNQSDLDPSFRMIRRIGSPRDKLSSLFKERKFQIICSVDYDCTLNKYFYLYFPSLNFSQHQVDLLSPREVAEISTLESLNVNFININICDQKDIQSIKSIISEDSKLKILASITKIDDLEDIDSILKFADGIVLSRTFQMINKENIKKIYNFTNFLVAKCFDYSKPIYSYIDINLNLFKMKKKFFTDCSLFMYNLIEGFDGFVINCQNIYGNKIPIEEQIRMINDMNAYFRYNIKKGYTDKLNQEKENQFNSPSSLQIDIVDSGIEYVRNFLSYYTGYFDNCVLIFYNIDHDIFKRLIKLRNKITFIIVSSDIEFLSNAKLYYNVITLKEDPDDEFRQGCTRKNFNSYFKEILKKHNVPTEDSKFFILRRENNGIFETHQNLASYKLSPLIFPDHKLT